MPEVVILQRVVSHYRVPLFERLHRELGWVVATSRRPPEKTYLRTADADFCLPFDFRFPDPANPYRVQVPVAEILRRTRARCVIAEFALGMSSTYSLIARRRLSGRPRLLFWSHGYHSDIGIVTMSQRLRQAPRVALPMLADGYICYGETGAAFLRPFLGAGRVFVAHNTLDLSAAQACARRVAPAAIAGRPNLLTVGRLTAPKRVVELVRLFKLFRQRFPEASLTIIGDGPEAPAVRAEAGPLLGRAIAMPGALYEEAELAAHFNAADVFVTTGAVGLGVNHALAYGLPVIAYRQTAAGPFHRPEIAYVVDGVTGAQVTPYSEAGMAAALEAFFTRHPDPRRHFGPLIADYVRRTLSLDVMVEDFRRIDAFIRSLTTPPSGRRAAAARLDGARPEG